MEIVCYEKKWWSLGFYYGDYYQKIKKCQEIEKGAFVELSEFELKKFQECELKELFLLIREKIKESCHLAKIREIFS